MSSTRKFAAAAGAVLVGLAMLLVFGAGRGPSQEGEVANVDIEGGSHAAEHRSRRGASEPPITRTAAGDESTNQRTTALLVRVLEAPKFRPVAGLLLQIAPFVSAPEQWDSHFPFGMWFDLHSAGPRAVTDQHGLADFGPMPPGRYVLTFDSTFWFPCGDGVIDYRGWSNEPIEVTVSLGGAVAGFLVGPDLSPLEGGEVCAVRNPNMAASFILVDGRPISLPSGFAPSNPVRAISRADGSFLLQGIPPQAGLKIGVYCIGLAPHALEVPQIQAGQRVDVGRIQLDAGTRLELQVKGEHGQPVVGAAVCLKGRSENAEISRFPVHKTIPPYGEAVYTALPAGVYEVVIHSEGYGRTTLRDIAVSGETLRHDCIMQPEAMVHGVVRAGDGSPVAGAQVEVLNDNDFFKCKVTTGIDGSFSVGGLSANRLFTLRVSMRGFVPEVTHVKGGSSVVFELLPGARLHGYLVNPEGVPVMGAALYAMPVGMVAKGSMCHSDEIGRFDFRDIERGAYCIKVGSGMEKSKVFGPFDAALDDGPPVMLRLPPVQRIQGRVTEQSSGLPISEAKVLWRPINEHQSRSLLAEGFLGESHLQTLSDVDGHFSLGVYSDALGMVVVKKEGYVAIRKPYRVSSGNGRSTIELDLRLHKEAVLRGAVRCLDGSAKRRIVALLVEGREVEWMRTDAGGLYRFNGLDAGKYGIVIYGGSGGTFRLAEIQVDLGAGEDVRRDISIQSEPGSILWGTVTLGPDANGGSLSLWRLRDRQPDTSVRGHSRTAVKNDGTFRISELMDGEYSYCVVTGSLHYAGVVAVKGDTLVSLAPAQGVVEVTFDACARGPRAADVIELVSTVAWIPPWLLKQTLTGVENRVVFKNLAAGQYEVHLRREGLAGRSEVIARGTALVEPGKAAGVVWERSSSDK